MPEHYFYTTDPEEIPPKVPIFSNPPLVIDTSLNTINDNRPYMSLQISLGSGPLQYKIFLIDTGSQVSLLKETYRLQKHLNAEPKKGPTVHIEGVTGNVTPAYPTRGKILYKGK